MNLDHTPLSRYKSTRSGQNTRSSISSPTETTRQKNIDPKSYRKDSEIIPNFKEGQVVKGEIVDVRFQEVKIRLEPGNQQVTARLSGDVPLSIGQTAEFVVTDASTDQLTLRYVPAELSYQEFTVQKALNASGLPLTERNRSLVIELIKAKLPIDKQTLQLMTRLAGRFQEASPLVLVLMHKHHIPITNNNIRQFEAYQNGSHPMLKDIQLVSKDISDLIIRHSGVNDTQSMNANIEATLFPDSPTPMSGTSSGYESIFGNLSQESMSQLVDYVALVSAGKAPIGAYLPPEELALLGGVLDQRLNHGTNLTEMNSTGTNPINSVLSEELINHIREGSLSFMEVVDILTKLYDPQSIHTSQVPPELLQEMDPTANSIIQKLLEESSLQKDKLANIAQFLERNLSLEQRSSQGQNPDATLTGTNLLTLSSNYASLLKEAFYKRWTLTPEEFSDPQTIKNYYKTLQEDMEKLNILTKLGTDTEEQSISSKAVRSLQDNLQFMKSLNELFTYVQLPIHIKNRDFHGDFYIFNKKKALPERKDNLSILLHLDMAQLGPLNIHVMMELSQIQATFYTDDKLVNQMIKDGLPDLVHALSQKGYRLQARVELGESRPDFIRDILDKDRAEEGIQRYSFDVRA